MPAATTTKDKKFSYGKIVIAFLLGCFTIILFLGINKTTFKQMLGTVKQLSQPNPRIVLVNRIFREVVMLDQMQRLQTLQDNPKGYNPFTKESQHLQQMLDTLGYLSKGNAGQVNRIASMQLLLHQRDNLFINYLMLRGKLNKNDTLITQLKGLSSLITESPKVLDSGLISTEKKVTTVTTEKVDSNAKDEPRGLWNKLFGRRKAKTGKQIEKLVKEELKLKLDTDALGKKDSIIQALSKTVAVDQQYRIKRRSALLGGQQQLTADNNIIIAQLLATLKDIETEETFNAAANNEAATSMVNRDLRRMDLVLILFIIATAVLVFMIIVDIAKSNRYRKQLILAKEEAEELGKVKQRFLANMSHELRTPLQTIIGMAEQMKINGHADEDELDIFYHSSQYLLQIVNEVLDYSRITSGRFQFDNRTFDMRRLLKEVANSAMVQAAQKGLKFIDKTDHIDALYVSGDPFRLKQVLYNLLGNAIKFTENGSVSFSAACREQEGQLRFVFTISDTGIGIAGDKLENIFSEFETLNTSPLQKYKGTGLGLNIAKALVEGQGGTINVSSTQGKGSTFTVSIPFKPSEEKHTETITTEEELNIVFNGQVWVVDDDKFILQLCHTILDKYNIPHKYFSTPEAVLSEPYDDAPVIVLLDIRLPGMSGMDVCSALKSRKGFAETKFIALTAQVLPDEKENIIHSGFGDLLAKPFMEQELLQMILKGAKQQGLIYEREERFDLSALNKLTGSDEELLLITIDNFITETERDLHDWQIAVKEDNYELMTGVLHRLASRCGQIGMRKLLKQLRDKEVSISHSKTLLGMETSLNNLYKTVQGVTAQLKNFSIPHNN